MEGYRPPRNTATLPLVLASHGIYGVMKSHLILYHAHEPETSTKNSKPEHKLRGETSNSRANTTLFLRKIHVAL